MIVTFYSFKGGVGRSFTLVETAVQLAARGYSVAVWDLDLEAPGIQRIPDLRCLEDKLEIGTLDLVQEFLGSEYEFPDESLQKALIPFPLPEKLAATGGRLSFLLPGKLDRKYPGKFSAIDWSGLFKPKEGPGPAFFYKTAYSIVHELGYEILLIDSRTGYTDLGAVCTFQIPDLVVLVFNLNEQNLAGIEQVYLAVTRTPARHEGTLPAYLLANMIPSEPKKARTEKIAALAEKGLSPHHIVPLRPELLLTDRVPSLAGLAEAAGDVAPIAQRIEARKEEMERLADKTASSTLSRAKAKADPEELEALRRRGIYERAKTFEEKVAELFGLSGGRTTVDYKRDDMQFDIRVELTLGMFPVYLLIECKDTGRPVTQQQVREFASKVDYAAQADKLPYQGMLVARSQFANNAHTAAETLRIQLRTYEQLLLSLVDLRPNLDAAIRAFQGTALERLYVEQDAVLEADLRAGKTSEAHQGLTPAVRRWLDEPGSTFLALLGDFGSGKTSFCKRIACELALEAREKAGDVRTPVLIDLREGGSTTVTLENLLTHHFQRLSNQPFNPQALLHLNREGYLLLIFDGFDETIGYTEPGRYLENLRQILRAAEGKAKVLLTCRTHYFRDRPEALRRLGQAPEVLTTQGATRLYEEIQDRPGSDIGYVLEFREEQIEEYLRKALPPPADWKAFREQIRNTYNLEDLAERPFLLEIIVKTLPRLTRRQGEVTIADLYESYCESWFSHTDFRLTLTRERRVALVEYLAQLIWNSPENRVHYDVLFEKATEFFQDRPLTLHDKERIDYEVRTALFLRRDAEGYYSFIHRSFLEFFIARTLRAGLAAGKPECLNLRRITREVAFFLEFWPEASKIPDLTGKILASSYIPGISENALFLLFFHARAELGPLVGPGGESEEADYESLRKIFGRMRPEVIHLEGADFSGAALAGVDLSRANLEGADLTRADLRQASLRGGRLAKTRLGFADLRKTSVENSDLAYADLNHVDAQEADFSGADLEKAELSFGRFTRALFKMARLEGTKTTGAGMLGAVLPNRIQLEETAGRSDAWDLSWRFQVGHSGPVNSVAWHPDGYCIATGADDGTIKLWGLGDSRAFLTLEGHSGSVDSISWAPDGKILASASEDKTIRLWDTSNGRHLNSLRGHKRPVLAVSWAPNGKTLASASDDGTVRIWETDNGRLLNSLRGHQLSVRAVSWAPDGKILASASADMTIRLWYPNERRLLNSLLGHESGVLAVSWAPDGQSLASGSNDHTVRLWDPISGRILHTLEGHTNSVLAVSWAPDAKTLASASKDRTVKLWDPNKGILLDEFHEHEQWVRTVSWAPNGKTLASGSNDKSVRVWAPSDGQFLNLQGHRGGALAVSWSPDGKTLASGSDDKAVRLWDTSDGRLLSSLQGHEDSVAAISWAPDGKTLASGSNDQTVRLWDTSDGRLLNSLRGHEHRVLTVSWAPDGKTLASGSADNTIRLWSTSEGCLLNSLRGHEDWVRAVSWAPDGETLASASDDATVKLWTPSDGRLLNSLPGHENLVIAISWAPDEMTLASGSFDNTVRLWDPRDGRLLNTLQGHEHGIFATSWAPDGKTLASASYDSTVRLWNSIDGRLLRTIKVGYGLSSMSWEEHGQLLVLGFLQGFTEVWDLASDPPRPLARFYNTPNGSGFAVTPDGYVSGPPEALEYVRFGDGWALYDLTDVPERFSPERVKAALSPSGTKKSVARKGRKAQK